MGKETKKKNKKRYKVNYVTDEEKEIRRFVIVLIVVILAVGGIYLLTRATNDDYSSDMYSLFYNYSTLKKDKHLYTVDLSNALNKDYYDAKNVNKKATSLKDLKVGDITLLEVTDGKITKYIVDYDKMQSELGITK